MQKLYTVTSDITKSTLRTDNQHTVYLWEPEYSEEEYQQIRAEADLWVVEVQHEDGHDYGYGRYENNRSVFHQPITDDILIVKDGHFAGIMMRSSGSSYNKRITVYNDLYIAFTSSYQNKKALLCARQGDSFSSDDHETWDITLYYLKRKEDITSNSLQ